MVPHNKVFFPKPYAFRTFPPFGPWRKGTSSAEWHEATALELGERVSEHLFMEMMWHAYPGGCWPGVDVSST